jgi:hypothetical protein
MLMGVTNYFREGLPTTWLHLKCSFQKSRPGEPTSLVTMLPAKTEPNAGLFKE